MCVRETPDAKQINDGSCLARRTLLLENQSLPSQHIEGNKPPPITPTPSSITPSPTERQKRESGLQTKACREKQCCSSEERFKFRCSDRHPNVPPRPGDRGNSERHTEPMNFYGNHNKAVDKIKVTKYIHKYRVILVFFFHATSLFLAI